MTYSIFYDLETTDTHRLGQIINFAFVAIDNDWKVISEFAGDILISRLQLPRAGAILTNRVNILEHQKRASLSEAEAMRQIYSFLDELVRNSPKPARFIGYNSSRFDLPFLRTSLIRNGFNPYFGGKLQYRDLLHISQKLALSDPKFARNNLTIESSTSVGESGSSGGRSLSLTLQTLSRSLNLLQGNQSHSSLEDVYLTIKCAKEISTRFGLDVRTQEVYEAGGLDNTARSGRVFQRIFPDYSLAAPDLRKCVPVCLIDADYRSSLWVDLDAYKNKMGLESIRYVNKSTGQFFLGAEIEDSENKVAASKALSEFKSINLKNFFKESVCDIEQDIYRVSFDGISSLHKAIWERDSGPLKKSKEKDALRLFTRHKLCQAAWDVDNKEFLELFRQYALYRYGGRANISKMNLDEEFREGVYSENFHPTLNELLNEIDLALSAAQPGSEDEELLSSLKTFYLTSEILAVAGEALRSINRQSEITNGVSLDNLA